MPPLHDLPPRVLAWASLHLPAAVQDVQQLPGSTSATLHRLELQDGSAAVVRQFDNTEWLKNEPDLALHEARSLERAAQGRVSTPHLLAFDETGAACGVPSVLMTCLPGVVELIKQRGGSEANPVNGSPTSGDDRELDGSGLNSPGLDGWLSELAATLAQLHQLSPDGFGWTYFTYQDVSAVQIPAWSSVPELWASAIALVQQPPPAFVPRFIHRDYHPVNVLWEQGHISGVVDWVNACVGPAGIDVGHCRVNLAQMYGVQAADTFRAAYEQQSGTRHHLYWDVLSLLDMNSGPPRVYPGWPAFGLTGLTDELMAVRLDEYLLSLMAG
ncbi:aminoglycoside phosphotransferase family protein [Deinococcus sp. KNUC1210]|uniref:phosphotransferase family protein n=1 Tax=Deinococcus sp. KNUC1210 TaxID=2917691 RepID=UPI001EF03BDD|nr:aminoglycoside phosphotransferase family protein [Deinococcus sp. KNUC1210]ULH14657.1 aminoglycoside phosphotransferase family protein [Deinococcus sp. KNUC1210]